MSERHRTGAVREPVVHDKVCRPGMIRSARREKFIDLYMATGDEQLAYEQAGYNCSNPRSLRAAASRLINDPYVKAEVQRRQQELIDLARSGEKAALRSLTEDVSAEDEEAFYAGFSPLRVPKLTRAEEAFVDLFMESGDAASAFAEADVSPDLPATSRERAARLLLNRPHVRDEIERRVQLGQPHPLTRFGRAPQDHPAIATREERQRFWTEVMRDSGEEMKHRLKASEYLARVQGDFMEQPKIIVTSDVRKTVQDLLGLGDDIIDIGPQHGDT